MDLTLLYYTSNRISDFFALNIRKELLKFDFPIISISQKPIDFGVNFCVGEIGASVYNVYFQVLEGAKRINTKFLACCEDDTLYCPEHFQYRPKLDEFAYNMNRWNVNPDKFHRRRSNPVMSTCIAPTDLMIMTLEERFRKYPEKKDFHGLGEPGRFEKLIGITPVKLTTFKTINSILTFNHRGSLGGRRRIGTTDEVAEELPYWGKAEKLWREIYG